MRYVIIRDDDTNALTPPDLLERLYRPFLERRLPVNLATIPEVATDATMEDGHPEGYLLDGHGNPEAAPTLPIGANQKLVSYLLENPGYHVLQHGCYHQWLEFEQRSQVEVLRRLQHGTWRLMEAGFPQPQTFVAPYDRLSRESLQAVAQHFRILSTGWFEWRRLPVQWWLRYLFKKLRRAPHWRVGETLLLSHPGCLLSYRRSYNSMLGSILDYINRQKVAVLVTHWWEYFRGGRPDEAFIGFLHETAEYLASNRQIKVISFEDLLTENIRLN